jgi:hypothetical protein
MANQHTKMPFLTQSLQISVKFGELVDLMDVSKNAKF